MTHDEILKQASPRPWNVFELRQQNKFGGQSFTSWEVDACNGLKAQWVAQLLERADADLVVCAVNAYESDRAKIAALVTAAMAAGHALRSYQYGNAATELAEECADAIDAALKLAGGE